MAIRNYKKISELEAITSASLSTYVAGVDNGQTVRITLDVLADGVRNTINTIDVQRLNAIEAQTGSYLKSLNGAISSSSQLTSSYDTRYVVSGSITQTTWDNIANKPADIISSSAQITTLGFISSSTDITSLNSFTSSQSILNTAFTNGISARLQTSSFNEYTASISTGSLVNRLNAIESVSGSWITESETGSFLTNLSGAISSSSQVIGILSSLNSVSASLISKTGSYATTGSNTFYGDQIIQSSTLVDLQIGETYDGGTVFYTSPTLSLIAHPNNIPFGTLGEIGLGDIGLDNTLGGGLTNTNIISTNYPGTSTPSLVAYNATSSSKTDWYLPSSLELQTMYQNIGGLYGGSPNGPYYATSTKNYVLNGGSPFYFFNIVDGTNGTLHYADSGIGNRFRSVDVRLVRQINTNKRPSTEGASVILSGSLNVSNGITGSTNFNTIVNKPTLISSSAQITTFGFVSGSYETTGRGIISSSANLVTTSSFNSYTASISTASLVTSISNLNSATSSYLTSLSGAISSSSQLTSSFDTRYAISASFVSSSNVSSIQTITSASYAALTPVSGTLYIIIG
jgi:hypothetical protein